MLPPARTITGSLPKGRVIRGTLPGRVMRQDATAPGNMYRSTPSGPALTSNERGSFAAGAVRLMRKALPINAAMFLQDLTGNKTPLTEQDLKPEELNVLRAAARRAGEYNENDPSGELTPFLYNDQHDYMGDPTSFTELKQSITDPVRRMATTIGGAVLKKDARNQTTLTDSFDFNINKSAAKTSKSAVVDIVKDLLAKPEREVYRDRGMPDMVTITDPKQRVYDHLMTLERNLGSTKDGKGIPSNINLGNLKRPLPGEFPAARLIKGTLPQKK